MDNKILKNVKLRWAYLAKPNTAGEFASNKYQVDLVLDGDNLKTVQSLKNKKQVIKEKDGINTITLKSSVKPYVYDKTKALLSEEDLAKIGNDTVAHVQVTLYESKFGKYLGLGAIKIIDLKPYGAGADIFGDDEVVASEEDDEDLI